jgi:ADP-heptose:LPS heptosyltransferase
VIEQTPPPKGPLYFRAMKLIERTNRDLWLRVLERLWPNEPLARRLDPKEVRRVLFLRYDNIGDMITTLPAIALMKRLNPAMEIDVLASTRNRRVIEHDPNVTRILLLRERPDLFVRDIAAARVIGYDLVVCCIFAKATKVGIIANAIASKAVKATVWRGEKYYRFFNIQSREAASQATMWDKMLHLVPAIFDYELQPGDEHPYIALDDRSREDAERRLAELGMERGRFIVMNITSARERNKWTEEGFRALADAIIDADPRNRIVILSMGEDVAMAERIVASLPSEAAGRARVYPPTRNILEVVAVVEASEAVFSLDTGVVHMASATTRPTLALYVQGPRGTDEWRPYGVIHRVIQSSKLWAPVATIAPSTVIATFLELLEEVRSTPEHTVPERGGLALDYERYYR